MKNLSRKKVAKLIFVLLPLVVLMTFSSCKVADLRTTEIKNNTQSEEQIALAKNLLAQTIKKHGFNKINQFTTYEVTGSDHWKGFLGKMGNP